MQCSTKVQPLTRNGSRHHFLPALGVLTLLVPLSAIAGDMSRAVPNAARRMALARYIVSVQEANPFHTPEPVIMEIRASLPGLYKKSRLVAFRRVGDGGQNEYWFLQAAGDLTVTQEVITPYLAMEDRIQALPASSVAVTPANYRFRYVGEVGSDDGTAYVFRIKPRRRGDGLIEGDLWIDALTGTGVLQNGRLVKAPSAFGPYIQVVRDTRLWNGIPYIRITHASIETHRMGPGELTITEYRLAAVDEPQMPFAGVSAWSNFTGLNH